MTPSAERTLSYYRSWDIVVVPFPFIDQKTSNIGRPTSPMAASLPSHTMQDDWEGANRLETAGAESLIVSQER